MPADLSTESSVLYFPSVRGCSISSHICATPKSTSFAHGVGRSSLVARREPLEPRGVFDPDADDSARLGLDEPSAIGGVSRRLFSASEPPPGEGGTPIVERLLDDDRSPRDERTRETAENALLELPRGVVAPCPKRGAVSYTMFSGLMSRWSTPLTWRYSRPRIKSRKTPRARCSGRCDSPAGRLASAITSPPQRSSITRKRRSPLPSSMISKSWTACGWRTFLSTATSRSTASSAFDAIPVRFFRSIERFSTLIAYEMLWSSVASHTSPNEPRPITLLNLYWLIFRSPVSVSTTLRDCDSVTSLSEMCRELKRFDFIVGTRCESSFLREKTLPIVARFGSPDAICGRRRDLRPAGARHKLIFVGACFAVAASASPQFPCRPMATSRTAQAGARAALAHPAAARPPEARRLHARRRRLGAHADRWARRLWPTVEESSARALEALAAALAVADAPQFVAAPTARRRRPPQPPPPPRRRGRRRRSRAARWPRGSRSRGCRRRRRRRSTPTPTMATEDERRTRGRRRRRATPPPPPPCRGAAGRRRRVVHADAESARRRRRRRLGHDLRGGQGRVDRPRLRRILRGGGGGGAPSVVGLARPAGGGAPRGHVADPAAAARDVVQAGRLRAATDGRGGGGGVRPTAQAWRGPWHLVGHADDGGAAAVVLARLRPNRPDDCGGAQQGGGLPR